jgi:hypothetical protein
LPCGKKGIKAHRVKVVGKSQKPLKTFEILHPWIPDKEIKIFSLRKGNP